jgi:hypothetical protein
MPEQGPSGRSDYRHFNDFVRVTFVPSISTRIFCTDLGHRSDTLGSAQEDDPLSHGTYGHVVLNLFANAFTGRIIMRSTSSFYAAFAAAAQARQMHVPASLTAIGGARASRPHELPDQHVSAIHRLKHPP